jgi:quercetin dioxygenase-like cupin family protein
MQRKNRLALINRANRLSKQFFLKRSTGNHSQRFQLRDASPLLSVSRFRKDLYTVRVKLPGGEKFVGPDDSGAIKSDARSWMNSSRTSQEEPHHIPERNITMKPIQTPKPGGMPRFICALIVCALIAAVVGVGSAMAATAEPKEAKVTELMSKDLADLPGKEGLMLLIEYPPGSTDPIHRHNAHGFIYVLEGSIVMQVRGGKEVTLTPGQTFYEGPEDVHVIGRNASQTKPAKFVVFFVKDKGAPVLVPTK